VAVGEQALDDVRADEAGAAGDEAARGAGVGHRGGTQGTAGSSAAAGGGRSGRNVGESRPEMKTPPLAPPPLTSHPVRRAVVRPPA
jgi:hypothetical protein